MELLTEKAIIVIISILLVLFLYLFIKKSIKYKQIHNQFKEVIDIESEAKKVEKELKKLQNNYDKVETDFKKKSSDLNIEYKKKREVHEKLLSEVSILEEDLDFISFGIYNPHFDFDASNKYKDKVAENRQKQKQMIKTKQACVCHIPWTVQGSKREGQKMTARNIKLMLRAFNNECDSAILKVKWNNVQKMEERMKKAYEAINKLGAPNQINIIHDYLDLKLEELYLAHEYKEKLYEEKEEQRRIREQIREEVRVQKEIEKTKNEADQEEKRYEKALEQVRKEMENAEGEKVSILTEKMVYLEKQLKEAQKKGERAVSRAQMTKSGVVYVISNIGSFGHGVYKIGMTRRLEPMDRVRELGDASVPFPFDVHAMITSDNAPELEKKLQKFFNERRLNLVNNRKEFFNVSLEDIEKIVKECPGETKFKSVIEAREFNETLAIRNQKKKSDEIKMKVEENFPASL